MQEQVERKPFVLESTMLSQVPNLL